MKNNILLIAFTVLLSSCGGIKHVSTKGLKKIPLNYSVKVANTSFLTRGRKRTSKAKLSDELGAYSLKTTSENITLTFKKDTLIVQLKDSLNNPKTIKLEGKYRKKRAYFEHYFYKNVFFIPIIYGRSQISRIRIGILQNGNIALDDYYDNSINYFILAGGRTDRSVSYFKPVKR